MFRHLRGSYFTWHFQLREKKKSALGQEARVNARGEVGEKKRKKNVNGVWLVAPAAAESWSLSSPQDLTQASSCPSSLSSMSQTIKEAAVSHCCNCLWQDRVTINRPTAHRSSGRITTAPLFDKLRSFWGLFFYDLADFWFSPILLRFSYRVLPERPNH